MNLSRLQKKKVNGQKSCVSILLLLFSSSVVSDSVGSHGLQHVRLPCLSSSPKACSNSYPLSRWCHPTISSSAVPFSSCLQSFPASGSFLMSRLFISGGQSIGASASAPVLPMNIQDWSPLGWTGWISLQSKGLSRVFSNTKFKSIRSSALSILVVQFSHSYITTGKIIALTIWTFVGKVMSLLFNILYRFVIAFLPRNKHILTSWLQLPSALVLEPKTIVFHHFYCFLIYLPWNDGTRCHDLCFWNVEF